MRGRRRLTVAVVVLAALAARVAAQSQGAALEKIREALRPVGWVGIDPNKDVCEYPGYETPGVICDSSTVVAL
jgi:hypothetical protein